MDPVDESDADDAWLDDVAETPTPTARASPSPCAREGEARTRAGSASASSMDDDASPTGGRTTPAVEGATTTASDGGYVVREGGLGALFGGDDGDDDWMTPRGTGAETPRGAERAADVGVAAVVTPRATRAVDVTHAVRTNGPFASPNGGRDDGMEFFNELDASAETESSARAREGDGRSHAAPVDAPVYETIVDPPLMAAAPPVVASEVGAATLFTHASESDGAFYEETHAPAEYPQTEFVGAHEQSSAEWWPSEAVELKQEPEPVSEAVPTPEPLMEYVAQHEHEQQFPTSFTNDDPPTQAQYEQRPPPRTSSYDYGNGSFTDQGPPPIVPAYSSENFHSRVSSTNSISDVMAPIPPTPSMPTFMVPEPIQPVQGSPMAVVRAVSQTEMPPPSTPPPRVSAGYASFEPAPPPRQESYPPAPVASYGGYTQSYETQAAQTQQYAAYGESQTRKPVGFDETERSPDGRPHHVALSFGFGGVLALTGPGFPGGRQTQGTSIPPCSVQVHSVRSLLQGGNTLGTAYIRSVDLFSGPLNNRRATDVAKMIDGVLASDGEPQGESDAVLYRVLQTMVQYQGELMTTGDLLGENRKGANAELARVLTSTQETSTGGWVAASSGTSPLNPAGDSDKHAILQVESLLIEGRRGEALRVAVDAKLWPHALLLAGHLGGRHYQETVATMARSSCTLGSPLHTLEILLAGISHELTSSTEGMPTASRIRELIPRWREHVAILCSNPTKGTEFMLKALGDELWRQNDLNAAHAVYALSKERPAPYSFNSRMCLIGADHRKFPRTYATPQAVQLTEILESALVGSNPQAQLPALLPYKLLHAGALAEVGKLKRALAYVESVSRSVRSLDKNSPEVNVDLVGTLAAQMEHRLQNALKGKAGRLADAAAGAAKSLVSGVKGLLDRSVSSLFGDAGEFQQPQPLGQLHQPQLQLHQPQMQPHQPQMLAHQPQMQPVVSPQNAPTEPRHERTPSGGLLRSVSSLFGGVAPKPSPTHEPVVSHENAFYYDEHRKMWLERGKEPPAETKPVGAPPIRNASDNSFGGSDSTSQPPPVMAPATHAKAKQEGGIHSRYVDTFAAQGGASPIATPPAQGFVPVVPGAGLAPSRPSNFFIPGPSTSHSRDDSHSESFSSVSHQPQERTNDGAAFYGYDATSRQPVESVAQQSTGAIPRPPTIDPSLLASVQSAPLPAFGASGIPAAAELVADEMTELNLQ